MIGRSLLTAALLTAAALLPAATVSAEPVVFKAADGVAVHGDFALPKAPPRGAILLLHMAGSNRGEYEPLIPALNRAGFATLAIDLRSGGALWGRGNETAVSLRQPASYGDAIPDIEAGADYLAQRTTAPLLLWGSSYSAALVFVVAARDERVAALLAFSPAEYIEGLSIRDHAARLSIPVFAMPAPDDDEVESARAIVSAVRGGRGAVHVPAEGVHGSSTLRPDTNPGGWKQNLSAVMAFLDRHFPRR